MTLSFSQDESAAARNVFEVATARESYAVGEFGPLLYKDALGFLVEKVNVDRSSRLQRSLLCGFPKMERNYSMLN